MTVEIEEGRIPIYFLERGHIAILSTDEGEGVWNMTIIQVPTGVEVSFDEPTEDANGGPLTDLAKTVLEVTVDGAVLAQMDIPASTPTGGGKITKTIDVAKKPNALVTIKVVGYACDLVGNESERSEATTQLDWLPPGKLK